jgi:hypothetical protein
MRAMRAAAVAALASVAVALAGCGSSDVGSGPPSSAGSLSEGAIVYLQAVSDPESAQWRQVEDLLGRFPDGDTWIADLKRMLAEDEGVSWEEDVKPALGDVVDFAVYPSASEDPILVALTNSADKDKTRALVEKLDAKQSQTTATRSVGDWLAISDKESSLDAALKGTSGRSLADSDSFKAAMDGLPDDAITRLYVDPAQAIEAAGSTDQESRRALSMLGLDRLDFAGAWAKATDDGAELALALSGEGADKLLGSGDEYTSALLDKVPSDAFAFSTFRGDGIAEQLQRLRRNPLYALGLGQFEREYGIDADEVAKLLEGETAIYLRKGSPIPEITVLLDSSDPEQAKAAVDRLVGLIEPHLDGFELTTGLVGDVVVLSTSRGAVREIEQAQGTLGDSDRYQDALKVAGAPDAYTGLAYVDLPNAIDVILGYAGASGEKAPAEVTRNLEPLRSFVAYGERDGSLVRSRAFLQID